MGVRCFEADFTSAVFVPLPGVPTKKTPAAKNAVSPLHKEDKWRNSTAQR